MYHTVEDLSKELDLSQLVIQRAAVKVGVWSKDGVSEENIPKLLDSLKQRRHTKEVNTAKESGVVKLATVHSKLPQQLTEVTKDILSLETQGSSQLVDGLLYHVLTNSDTVDSQLWLDTETSYVLPHYKLTKEQLTLWCEYVYNLHVKEGLCRLLPFILTQLAAEGLPLGKLDSLPKFKGHKDGMAVYS